MKSLHHLHIVSTNAPAPLNNATAIDLYNFMTKLNEAGVTITLHLLNLNPVDDLPAGVRMLKYTPKQEMPRLLRQNLYRKTPLIHALLADDAPILFVGIHTSGIMSNVNLSSRTRIIRIHRIEKDQYKALRENSRRPGMKLYYRSIVFLLGKLEKKSAKADMLFCTSERDTKYYAKLNSNAYFLPGFHPYNFPNFMPGLGRYVLYFGDLSTKDNARAVHFLLDKVFPTLKFPVIIAGRNPGAAIKSKAAKYKHILLKPNVSPKEMKDYIANAQVAVLPAFKETGFKMQFIEALYRSRHVIVNQAMIEHTGLESLCTVKNQPLAIINTIHRLFKVPFDKTIKAKRRKLLLPHYYSPDKNARFFINLMEKTA